METPARGRAFFGKLLALKSRIANCVEITGSCGLEISGLFCVDLV